MSDYDTKLEEWKLKHGIVPMPETSADELRMAAEEQKSSQRSWCFGCDKEMLVKEMKLITRRVDPYLQYDEGETDYIRKSCRVRMCQECFKEHYQQ